MSNLQSTSNFSNTELYTNLTNTGQYYYPREYQTDVTFDRKNLTLDGVVYTDITITGIPDGVSPLANEALIDRNAKRRLYIFSDTPLDDNYLQTIDKFYGKVPYKNLKCLFPNTTLDSYPRNNFYMTTDTPSMISDYVEYRYLQHRHIMSNICYNASTNEVYKMILPERPLLVIIMPANFIRTGLKKGYFRFDNNLIVRVYSKFILSSPQYEDDTNEITMFNVHNKQLKTVVKKLFARFGMHRLVSNAENQLYSYDKFMTMVVGSVANIVLP